MIHQQWAEPHERERTDTRTRGSLRGDTARRQCKGPEALDSARETLHPTHGNDVGQLMHLSRQRWRHTLRRVICSLAQHRCHRYHCRPIPSPARGASLANGKQKQKRAGSSGRGGMVTELQKKSPAGSQQYSTTCTAAEARSASATQHRQQPQQRRRVTRPASASRAYAPRGSWGGGGRGGGGRAETLARLGTAPRESRENAELWTAAAPTQPEAEGVSYDSHGCSCSPGVSSHSR